MLDCSAWLAEDCAAVAAADALVTALALLALLSFESLSVYVSAAAAGMIHRCVMRPTLPSLQAIAMTPIS